MSPIARKIRTYLTTGLIAATAVTAPFIATASAASASASACHPLADIGFIGTHIVGERFLYCDPPGVENPRPVTIQRRVTSTTWVDVTATGSGAVAYTCNGTSTKTYRLKEDTTRTVTAACG